MPVSNKKAFPDGKAGANDWDLGERSSYLNMFS